MKSLLADGMALPLGERESFVNQNSLEDAELRQELKALLDIAESKERFEDVQLVNDFLNSLAVRTEERIGQRFGAYRVTRLIAYGGMGGVYEGVRDDGQYEQRVAIKVVLDGPNRSLLIDRFDRERRILATLEHPNLTRLIDAGVTELGDPFFVMEFVEGVPIDLYCESNKLGVAARLALMRSVCQVVHYAHGQGVIHRDIKPHNILVTATGVVKLVDFGIAKRLHIPGEDNVRTVVDHRILTPEYASPEQLRGEDLTPASDVYALGVVLYRLLTGLSPYATAVADSFALAKAICEIEPGPPSAVPFTPGNGNTKYRLRGDLDAIVLMALRKEPTRRFPSADALADDLFRHLEGFPVHARRGAISYRFSRWVLRHRSVVTTIAIVNLILFAGIVITTQQTAEAHNQRDRATRNAADLRRLANTLMFDVSDALAREPGTTQARRLMVQNALTYLEKLRIQADEDPTMRLESARSYRRVGDILGGSNMPNIGEYANALHHYEHAISLAYSLLDSTLTRVDALNELAELHRRKAEMLMLLGKYPEALESASTAINEAAVLQAESSDPSRALLPQAKAYASRARVQSALDRAESFIADVSQSERFARQALAASPSSIEAGCAVLWAIGASAWFDLENFADTEHAKAALERYGEGRATAERLRTPETPLNSDLARLANNMVAGEASALHRLGRTAEAIQKMNQALVYWEARVSTDSTDVGSAVGLLDILQELGTALSESGQHEPAIKALERARALYKGLSGAAHASARTRWSYLKILHALGLSYGLRARDESGRERTADLVRSENILSESLAVYREPAMISVGFKTNDLQLSDVEKALSNVRGLLRR
ncbi:protein kinase domain-containing protein [Roseateles sp. NT4]|uniref:serine/threonine-protein kinase n=1 Tax=Roseateles sp. NT4 TaxID=3453715 RepID=UPI003EEE897F